MGGIHFIPQLGETDSLLVTDGNAVPASSFCALYCVEDTVFAALTGTYTLQGALADATFAAGTIILGNFTTFTLTSGAVVAYKAKP